MKLHKLQIAKQIQVLIILVWHCGCAANLFHYVYPWQMYSVKICKSRCSKVQGAMCKCMFFRTAIYCTLHYTVPVLCASSCIMHLLALKYAFSCLVVCSKTHILTVSLMHSHHPFAAWWPLQWMLWVRWLYALDVTCFVVTCVAVLSVLTV